MMAINTNQIQAMLEQIRATSSQITTPSNRVTGITDSFVKNTGKTQETGKSDFASALQATLDGVNQLQVNSERLGEQFALGNDDVQLSDVMISMQKASIALQTTVQARNKLVSAYQEIMGMQI